MREHIETIEIVIPKGYMNTGISIDNKFIADTNDSSNFDTIVFPLPKGKWNIESVKGKVVKLVRYDEYYLFKLNFEYEMYFEYDPSSFVQIEGWIPISIDKIKNTEKIEEYIEKGILRRL